VINVYILDPRGHTPTVSLCLVSVVKSEDLQADTLKKSRASVLKLSRQGRVLM
jgi:hypothetical protein